MKILYISPNPNIPIDAHSGAGVHIRGIINAFEDKGHTVYKIIAGEESGNRVQTKGKSQWLKKILKSVVPLSLRKFRQDVLSLLFYAKLFYRIKEKIITANPNVIYIRSEYLDFNPILLKNFHVPIVLEVNGIIWRDMKDLYQCPFWKIGKIIELKKYRISDCIIAIGGLKELIRKFSIREDKIFSVENGVTQDLSIDENKVKYIYEKHKIPEKIIVGFVGNMLKWHKPEYLIYAAEGLLQKSKNIHFLIVGGGKLNTTLINLVKKKNLKEYFTFTGLVNSVEVNRLISIMDICTIPNTLAYSSSVKLLNYGLFGKPVVVPRYPYMEELLEDERDGLLFKPGSISDFSEKILSLIENAELRSYIGENLQGKIFENYTWDKVGEKTLKIIEEAVYGKR